ncbi:DUF3015 domain-containing protein [Pleionea litopenaei]|uniref:DUF3015 domain-containing protein n=1 Tax=Pleionea litopenaei TaxID=3070815 RepID=A0AA51RW38_9GAMM|nr:DUF3015 domain-containing protein [Pleionea sp. HL-JVS1]WMS88728.1 DUF3015 domain-containing protein [Pleionea sp. HL-JVS1]
MKKVLLGAIVLVGSTSVMAEAGPGCGLGAQVFKGKSGTVSHVLAATTNGTSGNQTFGMTSGTLGCNTSQTIQVATLYMDSNIDKVAADMSKGDGEALNALAELLGVESQDKARFNALLKSNFDKVFTSTETTSDEAIQNIVALLKKDDVLKSYAA